jgi:predicted permease
MTKIKPLENWMRYALFATALVNLGGAVMFVPAFVSLRSKLKLPEPHPFFLWTLAIWIGTFGVCYFWMAVSHRRDRLFIATGAVGKLSFFGLLVAYSVVGDIPVSTAISGLPDLVLGSIFVAWLLTTDD